MKKDKIFEACEGLDKNSTLNFIDRLKDYIKKRRIVEIRKEKDYSLKGIIINMARKRYKASSFRNFREKMK